MPVDPLKEGVERVVAKANSALDTAEGEKAEVLQALVAECRSALAKVRPGGRLEVNDANAVFEVVGQIRKRFPGLDLSPLAK